MQRFVEFNQFVIMFCFRIKNHDPDYMKKIGETFQCPICNKDYSMKQYLDNHIKTVHMSDDLPKFKCNTCNRHFKRDVNLQEHIR